MTQKARKQVQSGRGNPYTRRLEHVRNKVAGGISLKEFHERLSWLLQSDGTPFDVSYSAARNYHYDREPPLSYLEQVSRVYAVRAEWLLTEEGPIRKQEPSLDETAAQLRSDVFAAFKECLGTLAPIGFSGIEHMVLPAASSVSFLTYLRTGEEAESAGVESASTLANAIALPLSALGLQPDAWPHSVKAQYVVQIVAALLVPLELEADRIIQQKAVKQSKKPGAKP